MNKGKFFLASMLIVIVLTSALMAACGTSATPASSGPLDGATLLQQRCTVCHDISGISRLHGTTSQWKGLVDQMIRRGAKLNAQEEQILVEYLAQTYK